MGVSKIIDSPTTLWAMFEDYRDGVKADPIIIVDYVGKDAKPVNRMKEKPLTIEDFEEYVACIPGMPVGLEQYFFNREGRYEDFVEVCTRVKRAIRADQIRGGLAGLYNASITQRLNGLVDKQEMKVTKEQPLFSDELTGPEKGQ